MQVADEDAFALSVKAGQVTVKPFAGLALGESTIVPA
jgi:hypothetical protein